MPNKTNIINLEPSIVKAGIKPIHPLQNGWVMWRRDIGDKDFNAICRFDSVEGFIVFLNNMSFHPHVRYTIMREGITPIWESVHHRHGGYVTLDMTKHMNHSDAVDLVVDILRGIIGGSFGSTAILANITGLTFVSDAATKQCRIWIKDRKNAFVLSDIDSSYQTIINNAFDKIHVRSDRRQLIHSSFETITNKKSNLSHQFTESIKDKTADFLDFDANEAAYWKGRREEKKSKTASTKVIDPPTSLEVTPTKNKISEPVGQLVNLLDLKDLLLAPVSQFDGPIRL